MEWIQPLERLGVEEFHDTDCLEALYIQMRCPNGSILANLDSGQTIMVWKGADKKAQMDLLSGEDASSHHEVKQLIIRGEENYRSSIAVNRAAQVSRAKIPLSDGLPPLTIKQVRSTPGVFIESGARFPNFPLDLTGTNLIVTRKVHHAVLMLQTLTSMLIPSVMLGRPSVGHVLTSVIHDLDGCLQSRYGQLCALKATSAPSDVGDDRYDVVCALIELLPEWTTKHPELDVTDNATDPKLVIEMFCDYVEDMFTLSETNPNLVVVATVHSSKGTQARTAYIFQPDFLP